MSEIEELRRENALLKERIAQMEGAGNAISVTRVDGLIGVLSTFPGHLRVTGWDQEGNFHGATIMVSKSEHTDEVELHFR